MTSFILGRGKNFCRSCDSPDLFSALDLGCLPIANELWENTEISSEIFPLHLHQKLKRILSFYLLNPMLITNL